MVAVVAASAVVLTMGELAVAEPVAPVVPVVDEAGPVGVVEPGSSPELVAGLPSEPVAEVEPRVPAGDFSVVPGTASTQTGPVDLPEGMEPEGQEPVGFVEGRSSEVAV